jgi:hypothetical protein
MRLTLLALQLQDVGPGLHRDGALYDPSAQQIGAHARVEVGARIVGAVARADCQGREPRLQRGKALSLEAILIEGVEAPVVGDQDPGRKAPVIQRV